MSSERFDVAGQHVVVIGGGSGIGRAIALGFRAAGASVTAVGRQQAKLDAVREELTRGPEPKGRTFRADMRDPVVIAAARGSIEAEGGPTDCLICCQGTTAIKPALELHETEYDAIFDTNTKSVFFSCLDFGRGMVERKRGTIITITSLSAHTGWARAAAYGASKWAVAGMTQSLAAEWGPSGVRVNAIAPGFFMTDLNRDRMVPERKAEAIRRTSMGRMGDLSELVGAAIYLASPAAAFVSGSTLRVDGGYLSSGI